MRAHGRRGFTVMEAIVALVILAVAIPPMLWAIREQHKDRISPVLSSHARWLASEKLEDLIADRHSSTRGYGFLIAGNYPAEASIAGYPGFSRSVAFQETGADLTSVGTGYKRATVTVTWGDPVGSTRSLAIATIVTDYTP